MLSDRRPILLTNARIVDPSRDMDIPGDVLLADGVVREAKRGIGAAGVPEGTEIVECRGRIAAPGLIDMRAFVGEPGAEARETIASATQAAAAGGVTTMIVMPNTQPVIDDAAMFAYAHPKLRSFEEVLRLAAGTLMADEGSVRRSISLVPIIGLGGALERKYTVRQNIYLIGGLIGMLPSQVEERLPWIVERAGIAKILDKYLADATRAVRAKLLWSIAMSAEASGYAISQAIVVGQPDFRKSCWDVVEELKAQGSTFLVTSDKPSHLLRFCDRAILLDAGSIVAETTVDDALERLREIPPPKDQVHFVIDDDDDDDEDEDLV